MLQIGGHLGAWAKSLGLAREASRGKMQNSRGSNPRSSRMAASRNADSSSMTGPFSFWI